MKIDNPIVQEVREARRQILASYEGDYRAMMRDMMQRQWESGHRVVAAPKVNSAAPCRSSADKRKEETTMDIMNMLCCRGHCLDRLKNSMGFASQKA